MSCGSSILFGIRACDFQDRSVEEQCLEGELSSENFNIKASSVVARLCFFADDLKTSLPAVIGTSQQQGTSGHKLAITTAHKLDLDRAHETDLGRARELDLGRAHELYLGRAHELDLVPCYLWLDPEHRTVLCVASHPVLKVYDRCLMSLLCGLVNLLGLRPSVANTDKVLVRRWSCLVYFFFSSPGRYKLSKAIVCSDTLSKREGGVLPCHQHKLCRGGKWLGQAKEQNRANKRLPPPYVLMLRKMALNYELVGSNTSGTRRHISQRHHSLTSIQTNNLLGTHDLNTRLRVDNSSGNIVGRKNEGFQEKSIVEQTAMDKQEKMRDIIQK
ncbi:hypothetical protein Bca101_067037 [Brassica carinata]